MIDVPVVPVEPATHAVPDHAAAHHDPAVPHVRVVVYGVPVLYTRNIIHPHHPDPHPPSRISS